MASNMRTKGFVGLVIVLAVAVSAVYLGKKFRRNHVRAKQTSARILAFFDAYREVTKGIAFSWGLADAWRGGLDGGGAIVTALKARRLVPQTYAFHNTIDLDVGEPDKTAFTICDDLLLPGDIVALGFSCPVPDAWIVVKEISHNEGTWNAATWPQHVETALDFSPDQNGFYEGKLRNTLAQRKVCACMRPWGFERDWGIDNTRSPKAENPKRDIIQMAVLNTTYSVKDLNEAERDASQKTGCLFDIAKRCAYPKKNEGTFRIFNLENYSGKKATLTAALATNDVVRRPIAAVGKVEMGIFEFKLPLQKPGEFHIELSIEDKIVRTFDGEFTAQ